MDLVSNLNSNYTELSHLNDDDLSKVKTLYTKNENKLVYYQEDTVIRELIFLVLRNQNGNTNNNTLFLLVGLHKVSKKHLYMEKTEIVNELLQQNNETNLANKCNIVLSNINDKLPKDVSEQVKPETKSNILNLLLNTNKSNFYNTEAQHNSSNNIYTLELDDTYQSVSQQKQLEKDEEEKNIKFKLDPNFTDDGEYQSSLKAKYIDNDIEFKNNVSNVTEPTLTQDVNGDKYYFDPLSRAFTPLPDDSTLKGVTLDEVEKILVKQNVSEQDIQQLKEPELKNSNLNNNNLSKEVETKVIKTTKTTTRKEEIRNEIDLLDIGFYMLMLLIIITVVYNTVNFFFQKKSRKTTPPSSNSRMSRPSPSPSNNNSPFNL